MTLYTTNIDEIYRSIGNKIIQSSAVHVITGDKPYPLRILDDFPNIVDVYCPLYCTSDDCSKIGTAILSHPSLQKVAIMILVSDDPDAIKIYAEVLRKRIPDLIETLGDRMRYLSLNIIVNIVGKDTNTFISSHSGALYINSDRPYHRYTHNIFRTMATNNLLISLETTGITVYDLEDIYYIPEIKITASNEEDVDEEFLQDLVYRAEEITIKYSPDTIHLRYDYSTLLLDASSGGLKRIKAIVPVNDLDRHLEYNSELEDIYVFIRNSGEATILEGIIKKYNRPITYTVFYSDMTDTNYWEYLGHLGDIIFQDIVQALL